jgi:hypothetical protein
MDELGSMMLSSPKFEDASGYFPGMSIDTEFAALNAGLHNLRSKLGNDLYEKLFAMSHRVKALFEADPEDKTDDTIKGRKVILEMMNILFDAFPEEAGERPTIVIR